MSVCECVRREGFIFSFFFKDTLFFVYDPIQRERSEREREREREIFIRISNLLY